jgi:hypothetical protein
MRRRYRYDRLSPKGKRWQFTIITIVSLLIVVGLLLAANKLLKKDTSTIINGPSVTVGKVLPAVTDANTLINEPLYQFNLPAAWKQSSVVSTDVEQSITWQSYAKNDAKSLTIYTDPIPATFPVNKELPVQSHGNGLTYGTLSDNCANFTTASTPKATLPVIAKWQGVTFYCNLPDFVDNQVGTGTEASINSVSLSGPKTGEKNYFFLYIDRNNDPDYSILYTALSTFKVK